MDAPSRETPCPPRLAKIVMVLGLGVLATLVALGDLLDAGLNAGPNAGPNLEMARHVLAMVASFPDTVALDAQ